jgi:hypothetical protein
MKHPELITCIFLILFFPLNSQPPLAWAHQFNGNGPKNVCGLTVDKVGNTFMVGCFGQTLNIDPASTSSVIVSNSYNPSAFIARYTAMGALSWCGTLDLLGPGGLLPTHIKLDSLGSIYITGTFSGMVDFDPGPATHTVSATGGSFILKLDKKGRFVWVRYINGNCLIYAIVLDRELNVLVTGRYDDLVDMNPGKGSFYPPKNFLWTPFVTKLDSGGNFRWCRVIETGGNSHASCITTDQYCNVYTGGMANVQSDFDPGPGVISAAKEGGYVWKLDSAGNYKNAVVFEGFCWITSVVLRNGIVVSGTAWTTTDIDPGPAILNIGSQSNKQVAFFCSLDTAGKLQWAKTITPVSTGGVGNYIFWSDLKIADNGDIYFFSPISGIYDFDPSAATYHAGSTSQSNSFGTAQAYASYDSLGTLKWAHVINDCHFTGAGYSQYHRNSGVTPSGEIYSAAAFYDTMDIDPGITQTNFNPTHGSSIFLRKLSFCQSLPVISLTSEKSKVCAGDGLWLTAAGGAFYKWSHGLPPMHQVVATPTANTTYEVIGADLNGCKYSAELTINVEKCTGFEEKDRPCYKVFPNPVSEKLQLHGDFAGRIVIKDISGRTIKEITTTSATNTFDLYDIASGLYLVTLFPLNNSPQVFEVVKN